LFDADLGKDFPMDVAGNRQGDRQTSIVPQLSVRRGRAAVEFYKAAFGAVEDYRVGGTDDDEDVVAQLSVGDASFWVSDESPPHRNFSPESLGGPTVRMLLIVEDPESVLERAIAAGATEIYPVGEEHGWRLGRIEDPFGHHWEIGKPLVAWPPAAGGRGISSGRSAVP
jgi:PhnB protein